MTDRNQKKITKDIFKILTDRIKSDELSDELLIRIMDSKLLEGTIFTKNLSI